MVIKKQELIENPKNLRPHVVLLGAGASRASFPSGDALGNQLPVMNDLIAIVGLESLLEKYKPLDNFEITYSNIKNENLRKTIEKNIDDYFSKLLLPNGVTHYDRLLLALREKDAIFTFNWDPFLFDAYQRNQHVVSLPSIYFLHGNVRIGACEKHDKCWGSRNSLCKVCNKKFSDVPLLYPIEKKNYSKTNQYTAERWKCAKEFFAKAFTITIFGYGAPTSDTEAVELLRSAWFEESDRQIEHIEIIDIIDSSTLHERWKSFTPTFHYSHVSSFEKSRLSQWPRRSCESLLYPMKEGRPCESFPPPETENLLELQQYIKKIYDYEKQK